MRKKENSDRLISAFSLTIKRLAKIEEVISPYYRREEYDSEQRARILKSLLVQVDTLDYPEDEIEEFRDMVRYYGVLK